MHGMVCEKGKAQASCVRVKYLFWGEKTFMPSQPLDLSLPSSCFRHSRGSYAILYSFTNFLLNFFMDFFFQQFDFLFIYEVYSFLKNTKNPITRLLKVLFS